MEKIVISKEVKDLVHTIELFKYDEHEILTIDKNYLPTEVMLVRMLFKTINKNGIKNYIYIAMKKDDLNNKRINNELTEYIKKVG